MLMEEVLSGPVFKFGIVPIVSTASGVFLRASTRNDKYALLKKEDWAVGPQLMLTAAMGFVVLSIGHATDLMRLNQSIQDYPENSAEAVSLTRQALETSQQLSAMVGIVALTVMALWVVSFMITRWGWHSRTAMSSPAVWLPFIPGLLLIYLVVGFAS